MLTRSPKSARPKADLPVLTALTLAILVTLSLFANRQFAGQNQLPMQFGWGGKVNWSAPRVIALSVLPLLAALFMIPTALFADDPILLWVMAAAFVAGHLTHLALIARHLAR